MGDDRFFVVGTIVNTQGARGDVRVVPATDDPKRFELLKTVWLRSGQSTRGFTVERVWYHKQFVILKLAGVDDMNSAESLKWAEVVIPPSMALPLGEDEYYERDLIGMAAVSDEGEELGDITSVIRTGANDVYAVKRPNSGKELLIPAIKQCVVGVDVANNRMTVRLMPGLLPEGLADSGAE